MNPQNYWQPRQGKSELRQLEQFFAQILAKNTDIFELVAIYSGLRNDQFQTLDQLLARWGAETAWFIKNCKFENSLLGMRILRQTKKVLKPKFKIK